MKFLHFACYYSVALTVKKGIGWRRNRRLQSHHLVLEPDSARREREVGGQRVLNGPRATAGVEGPTSSR